METEATQRKDTYFGGKAGAGVVQQLVNHVPPHDVFVVPFAGHCALAQTIAPCRSLLMCEMAKEVIDWWHGRLPDHALLWQHCGIALLEAFEMQGAGSRYLDGATPGRVVIYCDPPYRLSTRTSKARYKHDWTDDEHRRFLQVVSRLSASGYRILISHYKNRMYDAALSDWSRTDYTGQTRGGPRTESLYYNFKVTDLHDFRFYCGESSRQASPRRQREVMKRREQSARRKIAAMAPMERKRFLRSLVAEFGDGSSCAE
jgi:DNA adenine methylase